MLCMFMFFLSFGNVKIGLLVVYRANMWDSRVTVHQMIEISTAQTIEGSLL